ncbi:FecR domain-containing protein [Polaromonas sp. CT11-55]|uniref:FecR domain-containing protein n=1 Tax=Polaromonas sp. CT11-55 TaxID=3243045 RepID=UPI0039A71884
MTPHIKLQHTALAMALAAIYPLQAFAAPSAGVAQFIVGDVNVRRADGATTALVKGKDIESGQAILTGASGRAQVRFTDGGLVSLQPNTEFKVANYVDKADPKEDRFLVDLLRGSMRAITGLIGKRNRENYKVTTTTATIGIRGSGFNVGYNPDGSLGVTTELDAIEVCNAGGCVGLTAGESVRVVNNTDAPVRTNVRAPVPTPPPTQDPVVIGNNPDPSGPGGIINKPIPPTPPANTGTFTNLKVAASYYVPFVSGPGPQVGPVVATSTTLDLGKVTDFTSGSNVFKPTTANSFGSAGTIAAGDFIGWGTWTTATKNSSTNLADLHYIVGQPTAVMPTTTGIATYTLIGATPVTGYTSPSGPATAMGTLTSASMAVDFTNSKLGVSISTTLGNISVGNVIAISGAQFTYSSGTGIYVNGFFTGVNANRAGLVYTGPGSTIFSGAAAFQAP